MTLKELIVSYKNTSPKYYLDALDYYNTFYFGSQMPYFKKVVKKLVSLKPKKCKENIIIDLVIVDESEIFGDSNNFTTEIYYRVLGKIEHESVGLSILPWENWLSLEVNNEILEKYSKEFIITQIIYEMTFEGDTNEKVKKFVKMLNKRLISTKKLYKKHPEKFKSWDEIKEHLEEKNGK